MSKFFIDRPIFAWVIALFLLVVGADGKVEQRAVQVSRTVGDQWLVDGGLAAGDRVIVEGLQKVRPGADVTAVPAATAKQAAR
jgi:membrane fusion protein (multidrug efflux system)